MTIEKTITSINVLHGSQNEQTRAHDQYRKFLLEQSLKLAAEAAKSDAADRRDA